MHDAIRLFSMALREYTVFTEIGTEARDFANLLPWEHGQPLLEMVNKRNAEGISGRLSFDDSFDRQHFSMDVLELSGDNGMQKIATWDSAYGVNVTRPLDDVYSQISHSLLNRTLIVTTKLGVPFLRMK